MERLRVEPDVAFIKKTLAGGGASVKKCFQCATCSVVCSLAPAERPFPRKEMIWAQWGLKDKLLSDPHIWLCHQCDACSLQCPRGARPSEVLSAQRSLAVQHYSFPGFFARMIARPAYLPILLLIPLIVLSLAVARFRLPKLAFTHVGEPVEFARMLPHAPLNIIFSLFFILASLGLAAGVFGFWKAMNRQAPGGGRSSKVAFSLRALVRALQEVLFHSRFRECESGSNRTVTHILVMASFAGLLIVTLAAIVYILLGLPYPMPVTDPFKMLGNVSAALLFVSLTCMMLRRLYRRDLRIGPGSYFDWSFLLVLYAVVITGAACEVLRLAGLPSAAYPTYFVHLVLVFSLLIYAPYTKFAHVAYRTAAMTYCIGADENQKASSEQEKEEPT